MVYVLKGKLVTSYGFESYGLGGYELRVGNLVVCRLLSVVFVNLVTSYGFESYGFGDAVVCRPLSVVFFLCLTSNNLVSYF
jgi:hypothetical protein